MKENIITVREFLRNFKKIADKNQTFTIIKNGKPQAIFMPYKEWENKQGVILTKELLDKFTFKGGGKNLSKQIDKIVYKYPNPLKK